MTGPVLGPEALAEATARDRGAELDGGLTEVACQRCAGRVRVKKNSQAHTSIQWGTEAIRRCSAYTPSDGCRYLVESVDDAVRDGLLAVGDEPVGPGGIRDELVRPGG